MADDTSTPVKPGYKTTEFWLTLAATLLSTLFASGAITNNTVLALAGIGATVLTALGYKVTRTLVKTAGALVVALGFASTQFSCATVKPRLEAGAAAFLDCTAPDIKDTLGDLVDLAKPAVMDVIDGGGRVDSDKLKAAVAPLKSSLARCAFATAVAIITTPVPAAEGAPQSAGLAVNGYELRSKFAAARVAWGVGEIRTRMGAL